MISINNPRAFTLIELMLVVAIIGLLATIAIPKFANLVTKSKEAGVKGKLGALRSAVNLYYVNNEGNFPSCLGVAAGTFCLPLILIPNYIDKIPPIALALPDHPENSGVRFIQPTGPGYGMIPEWRAYLGPGGEGGWYYQMIPWFGSFDKERVQVNCTHTDSNGTPWSVW